MQVALRAEGGDPLRDGVGVLRAEIHVAPNAAFFDGFQRAVRRLGGVWRQGIDGGAVRVHGAICEHPCPCVMADGFVRQG